MKYVNEMKRYWYFFGIEKKKTGGSERNEVREKTEGCPREKHGFNKII